MYTPQPIQLIATILLFLTTFVSAWPWLIGALTPRQNAISSSSTAAPAATTSAAKETATASASVSKTVYSGSVIGSTTDGTQASSSGSATKKTSATATTFDARLPAGGITLLTPAATETSYVKIGNSITFAWNFTSLSATPTALDIMATCTLNNQLYTIAQNQSIDTTSVVWDTGATTTLNFPVASYTLMIYDSGTQVTAAAKAGYLAAYTAYKFGMYTPQAYTPLNEYVCATCSGALSQLERQALGSVAVMSVVTVAGFTWFIGGINVVW